MSEQATVGYNRAMFWLVFLAICLGLLLLVAALQFNQPSLSRFELNRRAQAQDKFAQIDLRRAQVVTDLLSLQRALEAVLLVLVVWLAVVVFHWLIGGILAIVIALEYGTLARLPLIRAWAKRLYQKIEPGLLSTIERHPKWFSLVRRVPVKQSAEQLESRQQLQFLIEQSQGVVSANEKKLLLHSLEFGHKTVESVMTPRSVVESVKKAELLGPLVLDSLHKTGHSRFPVIDGDIDHVVGVLYLQNVLSINGPATKKQSKMAEQAMEPRVFYVHQNSTLEHALAAFLHTHRHLFIVINQYRETVGVLSLEDVMEALLGRKIVDEDDIHDDLRAVAAHNPHENNQSKNGQTV